MTSPNTWISPGDWTAFSGPGIWVLADSGQESELVRELWQVVSSHDANADRVLTCLMSRGFENLAGFVIAAAGTDTVRLVARYPGTVTLTTPDESREIAPASGITWTDVSQPLPDRLVLAIGSSTPSALELPLALGASAASSLRIDFSDDLPEDTGIAMLRQPSSDVGRLGSGEAAEPSTAAELLVAPIPGVSMPDDASEGDTEDAEESEESAEPDSPPAANPYLNLLTDSTSDRDALLEHLRITETAPDLPIGAEPLASDATAAWHDAPEESKVVATDDDPKSVAEIASSPPFGLIDGVPGMAPPSIGQPPIAVPHSLPSFGEANESENHTISRAKLQDLLEDSAPAGPTVLAVRCPQGHVSNPVLPECRACGSTIPDQKPEEIPRPQLGKITMPNGDSIPLDKTVVLGRAPHALEGGDQHLVTVNTTGEISRQHALVTIDGWNVVLRDLNTTNGTFLTLPGQPTIQLRSGEDYLVEPGSEIDLADALTLRFEVDK